MPTPKNSYEFGPFRLELQERTLSRDGNPVPLRGKVFDTLTFLVANHGRLIRKEELLKAVWPDTVVEENNIDHNISQLRRALGETKDTPYIQTVPRQGYRFVATVEHRAVHSIAHAPSAAPDIVERDSQLEALRDALSAATSGRRRVVFVTGEAGIGKTTLVNTFLAGLNSAAPSMTRGSCFEHRGEAEPYLPILEAFTRLCRTQKSLSEVFNRVAPSWLLQMPGIATTEQILSLQQRLLGQTRERMLREMESALEEITSTQTLILFLEDLHWADPSTLDLVSRVARGDEPMKLLLIGTFRIGDPDVSAASCSRLLHELAVRGWCDHLPLAPLSRTGVSTYLGRRFGRDFAHIAAGILHDRTEGSPLFVTAMLENWLRKGVVTQSDGHWNLSSDFDLGTPESLRDFLNRQVSSLSSGDIEALHAASVAGVRFCAANIAAALDQSLEDAESACVELAHRSRFIVGTEPIEWPDGTLCEGFAFSHSFYRDVLYAQIPATQRVRMHGRIAESMEQKFGEKVSRIAAELAAHFREARNPGKCVHYLRLAGETALQRSAPQEALAFLEDAFARLTDISDSNQSARLELEIQSLRAPALLAARGFADPDAEAAYLRAFELARTCNDPRQLTNAFGLATMYELRGEYQKSESLMLEQLKDDHRFRSHLPEVRDLLACSNYHQGLFKTALDHAEEGLRAYSPSEQFALTASLGENPGVGCHTWAALSLWFLGYPSQALARAEQAIELADTPGLEYSRSNARFQMASVHQLRRDIAQTRAWAEETISLSRKHGYAYRAAEGEILLGWAYGVQSLSDQAVQRIQSGLKIADALGAGIDRPYFLALLAEVLILRGEFAAASAALDDADAQVTSSHSFFYAAELKRLRGLLFLADGDRRKQAQASFQEAIHVGEQQNAKSLRLRAAISFAQSSPDNDEALRLLKSAYNEFTEGFDSVDLREAAAFINQHSSHRIQTA